MTTVEFNYKLTGLQKHLEYFAKKLTGNEDDAQDLLQETFLKEAYPKAIVVALVDDVELIKELAAGKIDLFLSEDPN